MNEVIKRIQSPTPDFFKKLIKIGITIGAVGAAIIAVPQTTSIILPEIVLEIGGYMIAVGTVAAIVAKTTVDDSQKVK